MKQEDLNCVSCLHDNAELDCDYYDNDWEQKEKYYWQTADGDYIAVDDLEDSHIINIVIKFGKDKLISNGYMRIVVKFNIIRKDRGF